MSRMLPVQAVIVIAAVIALAAFLAGLIEGTRLRWDHVIEALADRRARKRIKYAARRLAAVRQVLAELAPGPVPPRPEPPDQRLPRAARQGEQTPASLGGDAV